VNRGGEFLKFEFHGSTGTQGRGRGRTTGKQVWVQRGFSKKKGDRSFSNPYPFTRLYPVTGTSTGHKYRLYPAGFSKPLNLSVCEREKLRKYFIQENGLPV
jgi:hypothetical protein